MSINYEWDSGKAITNKQKHNLNFEEEVMTVFYEQNYDETYDEEHSIGETRFKVIGFTNTQTNTQNKTNCKIKFVYTFIEPIYVEL